MKQLIFSLEDLWRRKGLSFLLLAQLILLLAMANFITSNVLDLQEMKEEVSRLIKDEPMYFFKDFTPDERTHELYTESNRVEPLKKIYNRIFDKKDAIAISLEVSDYPFLKKDFSPSLDQLEEDAVIGNSVFIKYLNASRAFKSEFDLKIAEGSYFSEKDYTSKSKVKPIVIGSELGKSLKVNQVVTGADDEKFRVIGILEPKMKYVDIAASKDFFSLDTIILHPQNENFFDDSDYSSLLGNIYIKTNDEQFIREIVQLAKSENTFTWAYSDMNQQMEHVVRDRKIWIQMQLMLTMVITIFTLVSVTVSYLQFIIKYTYEFGVHILSGASKNQIIGRLCSQLLVLFIIANGVTLIYMHSWNQIGISLIVTCISCFILWLIPIIKLKNTEIAEMLRWR